MTAIRPILVVLLALLLPACGSADAHNDADVAFATGMVPHHRQAIQMSDVLLSKSDIDPDVMDLATKIKAEQAPEIEEMTGWLSDWGAPAATGDMGSMGGMGGGTMSADEMNALSSAQGKGAQTLFLQGMIRHHEGAVGMAETELDQGENADAKKLAQSIMTSQQAEIDAMKELLAR